MLNRVMFIGNLGRDPEIRRLDSGVTVAKFSIATNESYKDKNSGEWITQTEWHDIVMWRGLADRAERQLKKGNMVYVEGKLTHRKYQDKDGIDRYVTEVVANTFRLLEKRDRNGEGYIPTTEPGFVANETTTTTEKPVETKADATDKVDDLPF